MRNQNKITRLCLPVWMLVATGFLLGHDAFAAPSVKIKSAAYIPKLAALVVKTTGKELADDWVLLHGEGGVLDQAPASSKQSFSIPLSRLGQVPCSVEVRSGNVRVSKKVTGAPLVCSKVPVCSILSPADGAQLNVNADVAYKATAQLKDKTATGPMTYEWDFAGGAMGDKPASETLSAITALPKGLSGTTRFVRDNSEYRIRFAATDSLKHRCEAVVTVKVGNPPETGLAKVAEAAGAKRGAAMTQATDNANAIVVLPFEDLTMQNFTDSRTYQVAELALPPTISNIHAQVIQKGTVGIGNKPKFLGTDNVAVQYSAASNPKDPAGRDSINSTSQNWPVDAATKKGLAFLAAVIQKTDVWEYTKDVTGAQSWVDNIYSRWDGPADASLGPTHNLPDDGYGRYASEATQYSGSFDFYKTGFLAANQEGPRSMPGKADPYTANDAQDFSKYDASNQWFAANRIPVTDVDDQGRVNPFPLFRIEAKKEGQTVAATDVVLSNSRDFHCRECHAKDKVAANSAWAFPLAACHSVGTGGADAAACEKYKSPNGSAYRPLIYSADDVATVTGGDAGSIYEQELAAQFNQDLLHSFNSIALFPHYGKPYELIKQDAPWGNCYSDCHNTPSVATMEWGVAVNSQVGWDVMGSGKGSSNFDHESPGYFPNVTTMMHRFHAELMWNADKSDIQRDANGVYKRWDWTGGENPDSLFPVKDAQGNSLPMEQNCLRCHAGHREPLYRDRMYTSGRTCYDCHGDMAAVGEAFPKPASLIRDDGLVYRSPYYDQPDCGACHTGTAADPYNQTEAFFSAGVKTRAFDDRVDGQRDYSATSRRPDLGDPDAARFAVVPEVDLDPASNPTDAPELLQGVRLFRLGKDQHAGIACAACHGAAHGVGPNRDPNANDNMASIQLQGYAGQLHECQVCHLSNSFESEASIGSTLHYPDKDGNPTILAGPHNMHPVNDPNWYLERKGDGVPVNQTDGSKKGGWHNVWAGKKGLNGEDQCAACHGADHKGTRLSKVPVDRVLTAGKVKRYKKFTVKAGDVVSCDLCHSLEQSFLKTPTGGGSGGTSNHRPVFKSVPKQGIALGLTYDYTLSATDADGDALTFTLESGPVGLTLTPNGSDPHKVDIHWATATPAGTYTYTVSVSDGKSSKAKSVSLEVCGAGKSWDSGMLMCM